MPTTSHSSAQSSVGRAGFYEAGDQRNAPHSVVNEHQRYTHGQKGSHKATDSKDERSIANRLAAQEQKPDSSSHHHYNKDFQPEAELSKQNPMKPAMLHGTEPSKGAKIDREIQLEEEQILREKGVK